MHLNPYGKPIACLLGVLSIVVSGCYSHSWEKVKMPSIKIPFTSRGDQSVQSKPFGVAKITENNITTEVPSTLWTLRNENGLVAKVTDYGATLVEMHVPDKGGRFVDVVNGFDSVEGYQNWDDDPSNPNQYFGCTTGRVCNRIAKGKFKLNGKEYSLPINDGPNHLHGGGDGALPRVMWSGTPYANKDGQGVVFSYTSPDGDESYPGTLVILVTYTLTHGDELRIEYEAKLEEGSRNPTIVNLTNHSYWNLAGAGSGTVLNHMLTLNADKYTVTDDTLIPTGEIADVTEKKNSHLDFRKPHTIGGRIPDKDATNTEECKTDSKGYDHNFVLNGKLGEMRLAATLKDPASGRVLEIHTVEPGIQFYSGNFLKGQTGKDDKTYPFRGAVCLETQHFPDSVNHADFPSTELKPSETYRTSTIHKFRVEE